MLIFLSFFIILYWILDIAKAPFIEPFVPFFNSIKGFVNTFYTRTVVVDQSTIDFSFLIATFIALAIAWGLKFAIEFAKASEEKYDEIYKFFKEKSQEIFNVVLKQEYVLKETKNNKLLILVKFTATNLARDKFFNRDADVGLAQKQREVFLHFSEEIKKKLEVQEKFLNDGLLLYFNSFKNVDRILFTVDETIMELRHKYHATNWGVHSFIGLETCAHESEVLNKIMNLILLIRLEIQDKMLCMSTFKLRYSLVKDAKYILDSQGVYNMNNNEESVFVLKI